MAAEEEFKDFADSPGIFKIAAIGYSSDPRAFLRQVHANIVALAAEEEFKDFTDTPGIFKHAATRNARDPRAFLRRVQAEIVALAGEEEFKDFADTPGLFKTAAVGHTNPRTFLRRAKAEITAITSEEEFKDWADTPGIIRRAVSSFSDPRSFLRRVRADIIAMASEEEFRNFANTPAIFKRAAIHNPSDPRSFLRRVRADIIAMASEEEFRDLTTSPGIFQYAAVGYPTDPRAFLRRWQAAGLEKKFAEAKPDILKRSRNPVSPAERVLLNKIQSTYPVISWACDQVGILDDVTLYKRYKLAYEKIGMKCNQEEFHQQMLDLVENPPYSGKTSDLTISQNRSVSTSLDFKVKLRRITIEVLRDALGVLIDLEIFVANKLPKNIGEMARFKETQNLPMTGAVAKPDTTLEPTLNLNPLDVEAFIPLRPEEQTLNADDNLSLWKYSGFDVNQIDQLREEHIRNIGDVAGLSFDDLTDIVGSFDIELGTDIILRAKLICREVEDIEYPVLRRRWLDTLQKSQIG